MARPTKSKEAKPKATVEAEQSEAEAPRKDLSASMNLIITILVIVLSTSLSTSAAIYFIAPLVIKPILGELKIGGGEEGEESEEGSEKFPLIGPVIDLEEFTVNLKDPEGNRYLRADFSLTVTTEDPAFGKLSGEALVKWHEEFHHEMAPYVPPIRDIIIASLTKRTAGELSSAIGKQQLKDEIKQNVDALFHNEHKVIRVNLENFIIQ